MTDSAESLDAKAIEDEMRAEELLSAINYSGEGFTMGERIEDMRYATGVLARALAEVRRNTLDAAYRALRAAETPELPDGQAIGLSLAREVLANLAYRLASPEAIRALSPEGPKR